MNNNVVNLGFDNFFPVEQVIAILSVDARYIKPIISRAKLENKLINLTRKRQTRSLILTKEGFLILTAVKPTTIRNRIKKSGIEFLLIGEENFVCKDEVLLILSNESTQIEALVKKARAKIKVFNTQSNHVTESYIQTKSGYIFLSKFNSKSLSKRFSKNTNEDDLSEEIGE